MKLLRRLAWPVFVLVLVSGLVFVGLFPTRTYLGQREATAEAEARLSELEADNDALSREVDRLGTDAEIERLAREQFGLAKPGEEVYQVLPPPQDPVQVPESWPFNRLDQRLDR